MITLTITTQRLNQKRMNNKLHTRLSLTGMNFLEFAVWGAYLISMGNFLTTHGMASQIGWYYAVQGVVSLFMPALMGIVADRWVPAQRLLGLLHLAAAAFMLGAAYVGYTDAQATIGGLPALFSLYTLSVVCYMPTIALSNSVAYTIMSQNYMDTVKEFPSIRIFGTIGFIIAMLAVSVLEFEQTAAQFILSASLSLVLFAYTWFLPHCPTINEEWGSQTSLTQAMGLNAFKLFKDPRMAMFFIFSMCLGISLQVTNGYGNPYITSFGSIAAYADNFWVNHANILISLSQTSETLCILLIPFFLKRFGIKWVMLIAMTAWVLRFAFLGAGDPAGGVWLFILSMLVYGVAFDFFNVAGSLFVDHETPAEMRSSAQGLFMMMTNGLGATIGMLGAQAVMNHFVESLPADDAVARLEGYRTAWYIFAGYAAVVAVLFALIFKDSKGEITEIKH